ncbi:molybdopterin dehydrogenase FAD-binding [Beutenbergia cavernae DSM 12333]|uniref:Molybdopterin dehydrogenase FAD-binding n=1 Tax=Beutenbergia cavernae (strain ATCC BAA-8 / DSM 12333 / CCUG 43141 / JCM 11478 / NBRC 16432 / NCIMB 13614 / HKI 0122) TaxID=471853 RepID=C5C419_BEUC1|nr:FAD binding domain-containing protein [Beutenbergia cavernae]ACQ79932.1 molybdopterin dehydrogenase FAD-binding [Beutenbergia cavernae DSM 12333]
MNPAPPRVLRPGTAGDVATLLAAHTPQPRLLAGGTDLLVQRRAGLDAAVLLDVTGLAGSAPAVARDAASASLTISAVHPLSDVASALGDDVATLRAAIDEFASTTIRNRATIGGNLVTGSPAADTVPALLAAGAVVDVVTPEGSRRTVPLADFLLGPRRVDLGAGEWVASVTVPAPLSGGGDAAGVLEGGFRKIGGRRAQAISLLSLAWQWRRTADGRLSDVRLAMGAVAPTVVRLAAAEALLEGEAPTAELTAAAAAVVGEDIRPIDDLRASAAYRRRCAAGLLREVLATPRTTTREKDL